MAYWSSPNLATPSATDPFCALMEVMENTEIAARSSAHEWSQVRISVSSLRGWIEVRIRHACALCSGAAIVRILHYREHRDCIRYSIPVQMFSKSCRGSAKDPTC